jgi:hypothetical protein
MRIEVENYMAQSQETLQQVETLDKKINRKSLLKETFLDFAFWVYLLN